MRGPEQSFSGLSSLEEGEDPGNKNIMMQRTANENPACFLHCVFTVWINKPQLLSSPDSSLHVEVSTWTPALNINVIYKNQKTKNSLNIFSLKAV